MSSARRGTAFVTGGSGFTGTRVVERLRRDGWDVAALARSAPAATTLRGLGAEPVDGDLDHAGELRRVLGEVRPTVVVNVASLGFGHGPGIVDAIESAGVRRAVFVSTTAIFTTLPAATKAPRTAAEEAIRTSTLDWTILRPTMIYGRPGDRNMERLLRSLHRHPVWPLPGGGRRLQQPVHVDDLADTIAAAARVDGAVRREYDVAGPTALPFRDIVRDAAAAIGRRPLLVGVPLRPAIAVLRAYERRSRNPRLKAEQLQRLDEDKVFDISSAVHELGHDPRDFRSGIRAEAALLGLA